MSGMQRRIEVWRPVEKLTPEQIQSAKDFTILDWPGRRIRCKKALIEVDEKLLDWEDLVVAAGLDGLCSQAFDSSGSRLAVFEWIGIGSDSTAPTATDTHLGHEVESREKGTYAKDSPTGQCSMDASFSITGTHALNECGLFSDSTSAVMFCRDTYTTKNVADGDTVNVYYTPLFSVA